MSERTSAKPADAGSGAANEGEGWWETIKVVVQALIIALVVRTVLFQPFNIPSGSLVPTLLIGDYLFVSKYSYGYSHYSLPGFLDPAPEVTPGSRDLDFGYIRIPSLATLMHVLHVPQPELAGRLFASEPKRGDIIVFKLPRDGDTDYIKRLIGLPGDKIQMIKGRLYINGEMVPRAPIAAYDTVGHFGKPIEVQHYIETLPGGVKHQIIELDGDDGMLDNTPVYEVPPGHYFMMGDNRDNSTDSRVPAEQNGVGYVPFENLIGRAEVVFFSVNDDAPAWEFWRWPWTVRWDRIFHRVH
jgi:signal peptidase I